MKSGGKREQTIDALYVAYYQKLERFCLEYVNYDEEYRDLVDDSIQETFLTAFRDEDALLHHASIEGWLIKTCYNRLSTAVKTYRRRKKRCAFSIDDTGHALSIAETENALEAWIDREEANTRIEQILNLLNEHETAVFHEYFEEERTMEDIALAHQKSVSSIKSIIARIRSKARKMKNLHFFFIISESFSLLARFIK